MFENVRKYTLDPTRTLTLRRQLTSKFNKKYSTIKGRINAVIIDKKPLKIKNELQKNQFEFETDVSKLEPFLVWLNKILKKTILETYQEFPPDKFWLKPYLQEAYKTGTQKTQKSLETFISQQGIPIAQIGAYEIHKTTLANIYLRNFEALKGINAETSSKLSSILTDGINQSIGARRIAKDITNEVTSININRANLLARTEIVRSHNVGTILEGRRLASLINKKVKYRWQTAHDDRVRERHQAWNGKLYTEKETLSMIGQPNCRCSISVVVV